jgi:hypothetical protein
VVPGIRAVKFFKKQRKEVSSFGLPFYQSEHCCNDEKC